MVSTSQDITNGNDPVSKVMQFHGTGVAGVAAMLGTPQGSATDRGLTNFGKRGTRGRVTRAAAMLASAASTLSLTQIHAPHYLSHRCSWH